MYNRDIHSMNGIMHGDTVRVTWGIYTDLETKVISLGVTDRLKLSVPVYGSLPNQRNTAWVCARNCVLISKNPEIP